MLRGSKESLDEGERGKWKSCLKLNIQQKKKKLKSWQTDGETMETVTDFIFLGSKIIADGDCSQEIKMFAPCKKSYDKQTAY